jgi:hypothetical protein
MKRIIGYLFTALVFSSCMKERSSDAFVPYPTTDTTWETSMTGRVKNSADSLFTPPDAETISVNTTGYDTARFANNVAVCTTPGFCLQPNGSPIQGSVKIELLQFNKKGDFIRYGKPTMSDGRLLDKQTIFRVKLTQYNEPLILNNQALMHIRIRMSSLFSGHVSVFSGDTVLHDSSDFSWEETPDAAKPYDGMENNQVILGYDIPCSKLGWISFGKVATSTGPKLTVIQPITCTNGNTAVYAVFKNQLTVLRLIPDFTNKTFFAENIPAGSELLLVSLSKIGAKLYLGASSVTMGANGSVVKMKTQIATKQQISDFLDGL